MRKGNKNLRLVQERKEKRTSHSAETLLRLYESLLKPRMIEEKMLLLLRQGKISKWFSGIGQEAIAVASTLALHEDEFILPLHRNLGVFTARNIPLRKLFAQFQGAEAGFTKGRDRSFHFGCLDYHIIGMISHLGPQMAVADGIALGTILGQEKKVTLVYTGEGGTSQGDFHEALNVASVWDLPVIFLIENNGYGLSTPVTEQYRCEKLTDKGVGYGIESLQVNGNDVLEVYDAIRGFASLIRARPRPVLIECMTFRMRGHEEASGTKYVPKELFEEWEKRDPVKNFEATLLSNGVLTETSVHEIRTRLGAEIEEAVELAFAEPAPKPNTSDELRDVYAPHIFSQTNVESNQTKKERLVDSVSSALKLALKRHDNLILMGQDIAEYGGVFKVTEGFVSEFGKKRIRNTPLCESAILGTALGLSVKGFKSVVEMQFSDFVSSGFTQVVNNLAKVHYRWGQNADVVIRMPTGGGVGAGPFHSQSTEAWFSHTPGLKIAYPAFPSDAKGLLLSAIEDPNPVMFFEHKALYRSVSEEVPEDYYTIEFGKARVLREGSDISIITYGLGVHWALDVLSKRSDISATLVDLRTLAPLDLETIKEVVEETGKVIILHEDTLTGGIGGEISAWISEHCFESLDGPVIRCGSLDTPVPFHTALEKNFFPKERFEEALEKLLRY